MGVFNVGMKGFVARRKGRNREPGKPAIPWYSDPKYDLRSMP